MSVKQALTVEPLLRSLVKAPIKKRKLMIKKLPDRVLRIISGIARNMLTGKIRLSPGSLKRIKKYKKDIRSIGKRKGKNLRKIISQKGGALPALLIPALTLLANIVASKI